MTDRTFNEDDELICALKDVEHKLYCIIVITKILHLMKQWTLLKMLILTMSAIMTAKHMIFIMVIIIKTMISRLLL